MLKKLKHDLSSISTHRESHKILKKLRRKSESVTVAK